MKNRWLRCGSGRIRFMKAAARQLIVSNQTNGLASVLQPASTQLDLKLRS
jgi:hypothetical protein